MLSYNQNGYKSEPDGDKGEPYGFDEKILKKNTTCHPWTKQQDTVVSLHRAMARHSQGYSPIVLAIDDPLGIAHELNGYYTEIFAKNEQYRQEREFEFNAKESYEYAMEIFAQKEATNDFKLPFTEHPYLKRVMKTQKIERSAELPIFSTYNQLSVLIYEQLYGKPESYSETINIALYTDQFNGSPSMIMGKNLFIIEREQYVYGNDQSFERRDDRIANANRAEYRALSTAEKAAAYPHIFTSMEQEANNRIIRYQSKEAYFVEQRKQKLDSIREKYAKCLQTENFDKKYQLLLEQIASIAEDRVKQVINWIKQSDFYLYMQDLKDNPWVEIYGKDKESIALLDNQTEIAQALADNEITEDEAEQLKKVDIYGIIYGAIIERSTAGFELSKAGKKQIEQWLMFDNIEQDDHNAILWQSLAHGSQDIVMDIQRLLKSAKSHKISADIDEVYAATLTGKLASYYKKVQGFLNTVENYHEALNKAQAIIKQSPSIVKVAESLGATMPKDSRLLKLFISKPALWVNNTLLRLANFMFVIPNSLIQLANIPVAYMFHLSLCGIPKNSAKFYLDAQKNINRLILTSPAQTKVTLPGGIVGELSSKARQNILARNAKFLHLQEVKYKTITEKLFNTYSNKMPAALTHDKETGINIKPVKSGGTKDARIALLIGILEAYNWYHLKQQQQALGLDEFWTKQMIKSTLALTAITAEIVAQYTKVVQGNASAAFGNTKLLSGFLGMAVSFWSGVERFKEADKEFEKGHTILATLNTINGIFYFVSGILSFRASLTYHIPWLRRAIIKKAAGRAISQAVIERAIAIQTAKIMARRALYLAAGFWVGVILLLADVAISYIKDDELEDWLKYCALGKKYKDSSAYQHVEAQKLAFANVLESMFGITEAALINNQSDVADESTNSDENALTTFNEYDALLLISQDLTRQKANRATLLEQMQNNQALAKAHANDALNSNPRGMSIPDIFSGNWH